MARGVAGPDKLLCEAQLPHKPKGTLCKNVAGKKTNHVGAGRCYKHGGATDGQVAKASLELATREAHALSIPIKTNPFDAIHMALAIVAGEVSYFTSKIEALDEEAVFVRPLSTLLRPLRIGKDGEDLNVRIEEVTEGPHDLNICIKARQQAVDRWVLISKTAIQANLAERMVRIEDVQAAAVAEVLTSIVAKLGVTIDAKVYALMEEELIAIGAVGDD